MYIFHCVRTRDYDPSAQYYGHGSIQKCGFIHCSDLDTYHLVAPNFADDPEDRILLLINTDKVTTPIRWEDGGANTDFPHIYGLFRGSSSSTPLVGGACVDPESGIKQIQRSSINTAISAKFPRLRLECLVTFIELQTKADSLNNKK